MTGIIPPESPSASAASPTPIAKLAAFFRAPYTKDRPQVTPADLHPPGSTQPGYIERDGGWRFLMCIFTLILAPLGLLRLSRPLLAIAVAGVAWGSYLGTMAWIAYGDAIPLATQEMWLHTAKIVTFLAGLSAAIYCWTTNRWHSTTPHWSSHGFVLLLLYLGFSMSHDHFRDVRQDRYAAAIAKQSMQKFEQDQFEQDQQRAAVAKAAKASLVP